jgi:capsular exopolysaccharide synthesis family protein
MSEPGELERLLASLGRHVVLVAVVAVVAGATAFATSVAQKSQYRATSKVLYNPAPVAGSLDPERAITTLVALVKTAPVLDAARKQVAAATRLDLDTRTSVSAALNEDIIDIIVVADSPKAAANDSRAVANAFVAYWASAQKQAISAQIGSLRRQLEALAGRATPSAVAAAADLRTQIAEANANLASSGSDLVLVQPATPPSGRFSPHPLRNLFIGLLAGVILGGILAVVRERTDRRLRSVGDMETAYGLPVLGTVPRIDEAAFGRRALGFSDFTTTTPLAESYRAIRTNLDIVNGGAPPRVIVVTSAVQAEGKSAVSANLAAAIAQTGRNVLAVSGDLRAPTLHEYFQTRPSDGLVGVLAGDVSFDRATQRIEIGANGASGHGGRLSLLASSRRVIDPAFLFQSPAMSRVIDQAEGHFDVVVIDTVPLLSAPEATVLAKRADAVVLVAAIDVVTRTHTKRTLQMLQVAGAKPAGIVVTGGGSQDVPSYAYTTQ